MTKKKMQRIVNRRPGPTTPDIVHIWSEWIDEFGVRRAICGENCPRCGESFRGNVLFPPLKFKELDHEDMIYCMSCGGRFRTKTYEFT